MDSIKDLLKQNFLYKTFFNSRIEKRQAKEIKRWTAAGSPIPPPHEYKQQVIINYSKRFQLSALVETGTFMGFMIEIMRYRFAKIVSIELDNELFEKAKIKFANDKHIKIIQGDSAKMLPVALSMLSEPALFWLDGHYSGGVTAKGELNTPIMSELKSILDHSVPGHVILIDDARCFVNNSDYPSIEQLRDLVKRYQPNLSFIVEKDIIRIH